MKDSLLKSFKTTQITNNSLIVGGATNATSDPELVSSDIYSNCNGYSNHYMDWKGSDGTWYSDECRD